MKTPETEKRKHERVPTSRDADLAILGALAHSECALTGECQEANVVHKNGERMVISTTYPLKNGDFIKMNNGRACTGVVMWVLSHENSYKAEVLIL